MHNTPSLMRTAKESTQTMSTTTMSITTVGSIYIPRIRREHTAQSIHDILYAHVLVDRVDLVPLPESNTDTTKFMSAYVYISEWNAQNPESLEIYNVLASNVSYKFNVPNHREYWFLCKNHKPVPNTHMNIHQLAESNRILHERVTVLENMVAKLSATTTPTHTCDCVGESKAPAIAVDDLPPLSQIACDVTLVPATVPKHLLDPRCRGSPSMFTTINPFDLVVKRLWHVLRTSPQVNPKTLEQTEHGIKGCYDNNPFLIALYSDDACPSHERMDPSGDVTVLVELTRVADWYCHKSFAEMMRLIRAAADNYFLC